MFSIWLLFFILAHASAFVVLTLIWHFFQSAEVLVNSLALVHYELAPPIVENILSDIYQSFGSSCCVNWLFKTWGSVKCEACDWHVLFEISGWWFRQCLSFSGKLLARAVRHCPNLPPGTNNRILEVPAATSRLQRSNLLSNFHQVPSLANSMQ